MSLGSVGICSVVIQEECIIESVINEVRHGVFVGYFSTMDNAQILALELAGFCKKAACVKVSLKDNGQQDCLFTCIEFKNAQDAFSSLSRLNNIKSLHGRMTARPWVRRTGANDNRVGSRFTPSDPGGDRRDYGREFTYAYDQA